MENTKNEKQCAIHDAIVRLFKEMSEKHQIAEDAILLQYQDNTLSICEQDYDSLKILEQINL